MNCEGTLKGDNIYFLRQGAALLEALGDELFTSQPPIRMSAVGAHLRHCLDTYTCFLAGLQTGRVDYDSRNRDPRLETDRAYALEALASIIRRLEASPLEEQDRPLLAAMDRGAGEQGEAAWSQTSVRRELQFLRSHTVHHYALIAAVLRVQGYEPPADFGVAPATLTYRRESATSRA